MGSTEEWRGRSKESINSNVEYKLPSLFNREKIHWKNKTKIQNISLRTCGILTKDLTFISWRVSETQDKDSGTKKNI